MVNSNWSTPSPYEEGEVYAWGWKECVPSGKVIFYFVTGGNLQKDIAGKQSSSVAEQDVKQEAHRAQTQAAGRILIMITRKLERMSEREGRSHLPDRNLAVQHLEMNSLLCSVKFEDIEGF
ncbi:hypothetical protein RIF29_01901 [Crotalaria pallida]|uniref:Uncharacterized protein n=1 Tax=Crotalaria pallida TaxID=3830 RepID=A0AAN9IXY7_CROPI